MMATLPVRPLVEMMFSISLLMMPCAARTELLDRCRWNTSEPVIKASHTAAETGSQGGGRGRGSQQHRWGEAPASPTRCDILSQMRTPQVFSGKRANWTSWKIQTVDAVANAARGEATKGRARSARVR